MNEKYLRLLAEKFPTVESAASEIINLSAIRSLPKGTEYFFSDLHGEYEAFLYMLRSASGMIKIKTDKVLSKTVSSAEREAIANLICYPESGIKRGMEKNDEEWQRLTIYRLILVCEAISSKYTRSRVRKSIPEKFRYIVDELLNVTDDVNKDYYYDKIISSIIETGISEDFIISLCHSIRALAIDKLHIIGDIYDRGPRPDIILDELMLCHDVDIQWGNHDISWIGAAAGNLALIANALRISIKYNNFDFLEDGYGLNMRALAVFAGEVYSNDDCAMYYPQTYDDNVYDPIDDKLAAQMHKAITVIQLKLESALISAHPEWNMNDRNLLNNIDYNTGTVTVNGKAYPLKDTRLPTIDPENPSVLTESERELMTVLKYSFLHSEKLQKHTAFLLSKGAMYNICNGNLMFHGCIPMESDGTFQALKIDGKAYSGKELLDKVNVTVNHAYYSKESNCVDFMWYLWCGACSPLFGKNKMAFFEKYFVDDKSLHEESYNSYYKLSESAEVAGNILSVFGLDPKRGHIINGHVPVKIRDGENPVKADGRLFVIDGGISKAYQKTTGIAGYTLIYDSHSISLAEHKPFRKKEEEQGSCQPKIQVVEKLPCRANISDTDKGEELLEQINDLKELLSAYKNGNIKPKNYSNHSIPTSN